MRPHGRTNWTRNRASHSDTPTPDDTGREERERLAKLAGLLFNAEAVTCADAGDEKAAAALHRDAIAVASILRTPAGVESGELERLRAEIERLRPRQQGNGSTHWEGCWEARHHHDCAVAEINRLRSAPPSGWRTMESAPKDETYVLASWTDDSDPAYYEPSVVAFFPGEGWRDSYGAEYSMPTHWMPLPAPPLHDVHPAREEE